MEYKIGKSEIKLGDKIIGITEEDPMPTKFIVDTRIYVGLPYRTYKDFFTEEAIFHDNGNISLKSDEIEVLFKKDKILLINLENRNYKTKINCVKVNDDFIYCKSSLERTLRNHFSFVNDCQIGIRG